MMCREGGTSCATPQVAGVAALLLQNNPTLTPFEVKALLMLGAQDVSAGKSYSGAYAKRGWDAATGYGLVDAMTSWSLVP
jgi:subtilisin family serine protease